MSGGMTWREMAARIEALEQRDDLTRKTLEGHNLRLERLEDVLRDEPERLPVAMRMSLLEGTVSGLIAGLREEAADGNQCACRTLPICSAVQDDECLSVRGKWPSHACGFREGHDGSHHCESCFYEWGGGSDE